MFLIKQQIPKSWILLIWILISCPSIVSSVIIYDKPRTVFRYLLKQQEGANHSNMKIYMPFISLFWQHIESREKLNIYIFVILHPSRTQENMASNTGVDQDENDFSSTTPIANIWQVIFFSLDCIVMLISLFLNMCLVRAIARNIYKETPLYFFILFIFFTSLVDDALIIEHFMTLFGHQQHTDTICQFFMFTTLGNRLLQVNTVLALLYYS